MESARRPRRYSKGWVWRRKRKGSKPAFQGVGAQHTRTPGSSRRYPPARLRVVTKTNRAAPEGKSGKRDRRPRGLGSAASIKPERTTEAASGATEPLVACLPILGIQ